MLVVVIFVNAVDSPLDDSEDDSLLERELALVVPLVKVVTIDVFCVLGALDLEVERGVVVETLLDEVFSDEVGFTAVDTVSEVVKEDTGVLVVFPELPIVLVVVGIGDDVLGCLVLLEVSLMEGLVY